MVWGNRIQTLMASQASVRGPHPQRLRVDEIDEVPLAILDAALGQPMGSDGISSQTALSSTHQYADGTMTEVLKRAGENGWPVYEWCYRETLEPHGWLPQVEVDQKRTTVTASMWDTEYEGQEPSPESRAIQPGAVEAMFDSSIGKWQGLNQQRIEIEAPVDGATYATGADWARKQDWTVIVTLRMDTNPARVVAFERCGRLPWPVMVKKFDDRVNKYRGGAAHDGTGIGDVVAGYMTVRAQNVVMVGRSRQDMISEYIAAIERGEISAPMIDFMHREHKYASVDDVYGSGHLPDSIAAGALAYSARRRGVIVG